MTDENDSQQQQQQQREHRRKSHHSKSRSGEEQQVLSEEEKQLKESLRVTSEQRRQRRKMNLDIYRSNKENELGVNGGGSGGSVEESRPRDASRVKHNSSLNNLNLDASRRDSFDLNNEQTRSNLSAANNNNNNVNSRTPSIAARRKSEMMTSSDKLPPRPSALKSGVDNDSDDNEAGEEESNDVAVDVLRARGSAATSRTEAELNGRHLFNDFNLDFFKLIRKTSMLNFILTPPPQGTIVRCKIICRKGIFNEYSFYLEDSQHNDILLMKTHRQMTTARAAHIITCLNTTPNANVNMSGSYSSFALTDYYSPSAGSNQYIAGIELPCAKIKSNISRKKFKLELDTSVMAGSPLSPSSSMASPRTMITNGDLLNTLFKSSLSEPRRIIANACLCSGVSFNQDKVTYFFKNRPPYYDFQQRKYVLDYGGRAKQSSKNNFQIIDESSDEMIMQLGKVETGWYNCDFSFPLCALQAFGFALSSLCR